MSGCCPIGSWPALKTQYEPTGKWVKVGSVQVYHSPSKALNSPAIIMIEDIFGAKSSNHRSVADTFALNGYDVYLPALLEKPYDGPMDMGPIVENIKTQHWDVLSARFKEVMGFVQSNGHQTFKLIGFCWGVWLCFKLSVEFKQITRIVGYHPSLGVEGIFGGDPLKLSQAINAPACLLPAGNDPDDIKTGGAIVNALTTKFPNQIETHEFKDMQHGWMVRGERSEPTVLAAVEKGVKIGLDYFGRDKKQ